MKTHVAFLPSPGMGHAIPLLELAKRLVINFDIKVSFLNITTESSAAQNNLLHSSTLPPGLHMIDLPPADVYFTDNILTDDMPILTRICLIVEESMNRCVKSVLVNMTDDNKPAALIIDIFCTQAFDICNEISIPTYSFFTASTALLAFSIYLPTLDREVVDREFVDLPEPVRVPGCNPIRTEDLLDQVRNRKIDDYRWYLFHVSRLPMAAGIFLNTWEELEPVSLLAIRDNPFYKQISLPPVHPIGPIIKQSGPLTESDDNKCLKWLDRQPADSVIYIALGSGGTLSKNQIHELAWGLELSEKRFLWVARKPSDESASAAFFNVASDVKDPKTYMPEGFLERTKEVGLVVPSWAPQIEILRHRATAAFVSHCGWNSTVESISHGVAMITWPLYSEQRMNATILTEEVGVGLRLRSGGRGLIDRDEIKSVVKMVMEGEERKIMRRRLRELADSAVKAAKNCTSSVPTTSFDTLSAVVRQWKTE